MCVLVLHCVSINETQRESHNSTEGTTLLLGRGHCHFAFSPLVTLYSCHIPIMAVLVYSTNYCDELTFISVITCTCMLGAGGAHVQHAEAAGGEHASLLARVDTPAAGYQSFSNSSPQSTGPDESAVMAAADEDRTRRDLH